ncbi:hypothetical protein [Rhodococcus phenolicus]|uniref:hypothetical protein n=1 Tax=Rhodococcus phenolicus TaxID=263849 RepID=UPI000829E08E|nr:hypothetical protein [Rhodococcus phenolicus]
MSIRDELTRIISAPRMHTNESLGKARAIADAILARYAVVERPEANGGPMGIEWASNGGHVTGRVLAIGDDGQPFEILTITYTVEQAAQMATHLIDAIGGKR